jgi:hypothetical protein
LPDPSPEKSAEKKSSMVWGDHAGDGKKRHISAGQIVYETGAAEPGMRSKGTQLYREA